MKTWLIIGLIAFFGGDQVEPRPSLKYWVIVDDVVKATFQAMDINTATKTIVFTDGRLYGMAKELYAWQQDTYIEAPILEQQMLEDWWKNSVVPIESKTITVYLADEYMQPHRVWTFHQVAPVSWESVPFDGKSDEFEALSLTLTFQSNS